MAGREGVVGGDTILGWGTRNTARPNGPRGYAMGNAMSDACGTPLADRVAS